MLCCGKCFGDRDLRRQIIDRISTNVGTCPRCGTQNEKLIEPSELTDYFFSLAEAYELDAAGRPLLDWLRSDWGMFDASILADRDGTALLADVLSGDDLATKPVVPVRYGGITNLERWETLRAELMHQNRFFPRSEMALERVSELLTMLKMGEGDIPKNWFRARIEKEGEPYPAAKMGAPPPNVTTHGRANPAGIPYLYLGSIDSTAVAEVRPQPGETVCVAEYAINPAALNLVDLRRPRVTVSPFMVEDVAALRADLTFLERLGDELKTPVLADTAAIAYIPSQYLCEYIKRDGYDGVVYGSSLSAGINLALFYPEKAQIGEIKEFLVTKVEVFMALRPHD